MNSITDDEITNVLEKHEALEQSLKLRLEQAMVEHREAMSEVEVSFIKSHDYSNSKLSESYHISDPVYDIYIRLMDTGYSEKVKQLEYEIDDIRKRQAHIARVCTAYHRLASIVPKAYYMMYELHYIPINVRRHSWRTMMKEMDRSRRYVSEGLALVVELIRQLYESEYGTNEFTMISDGVLREMFSQEGKAGKKMRNY